MLFDIQCKNPKVKEGYTLASLVLMHPGFSERISAISAYTYTKATPEEVYKAYLRGLTLPPVAVKSNLNSPSVIAATKVYPWDLESIYVNERNIPFKNPSAYFENGVHEWTHSPMGFDHGTNFPPGSWRGRMLGDFADKNKAVAYTFVREAKAFAKSQGLL